MTTRTMRLMLLAGMAAAEEAAEEAEMMAAEPRAADAPPARQRGAMSHAEFRAATSRAQCWVRVHASRRLVRIRQSEARRLWLHERGLVKVVPLAARQSRLLVGEARHAAVAAALQEPPALEADPASPHGVRHVVVEVA